MNVRISLTENPVTQELVVLLAAEEEEGDTETNTGSDVQGAEEEGTEGIAEEEHEEFEAHHPWWPETKEIVWGGLAFLIVLGALVKFAGPAVRKGMAARSDRIGRELDEASRARADAERRSTEIRAAKGDIEAERARITAEANTAAERLLAEGRARLDTDVAELEARAETEIAGTANRLLSELQAQVASLAMTATERVVAAELDSATQTDLVESFIARVGVANGAATAAAASTAGPTGGGAR